MPPKFTRNYYQPQESEATRSLLGGNSDDDSDDGYNSGNRRRPPRGGARGDPKVQQVQDQVDEVVEVMRNNIGKVLERGDRLEDLEDRSERLMDSAQAFKRGTKKLTWQMWYQNLKWKLLVFFAILVVLLIIIVPIATKK